LFNQKYLVRHGDALGAIAKAYNLSVQELLDLNPGIINPNFIREGDSLLVPLEAPAVSPHLAIAQPNFSASEPDWLKIAQREEGVVEIPGAGNNPRILEYHASTNLDKSLARRDATAWCSSFANWCLVHAGQIGTNSASALSWRNWGSPLSLDAPVLGCLAVFSRAGPGSSGGHVGFFLADQGDHILVLGGNQGDSVRRSLIPINGFWGTQHMSLLTYRWPQAVPVPQRAVPV
jgi:uncharacterized protein (TIGR02594 family)